MLPPEDILDMSHEARSGPDRPTACFGQPAIRETTDDDHPWRRSYIEIRDISLVGLPEGQTGLATSRGHRSGRRLRIRRGRGRRSAAPSSGAEVLLCYCFQPNSTSVNTSVSPMPVFAMFEFRPSVHAG